MVHMLMVNAIRFVKSNLERGDSFLSRTALREGFLG